jgi:hypothetical protein
MVALLLILQYHDGGKDAIIFLLTDRHGISESGMTQPELIYCSRRSVEEICESNQECESHSLLMHTDAQHRHHQRMVVTVTESAMPDSVSNSV